MALIEIKMKVYRPKRPYQQHLETMTEDQKKEYLKEQEQREYEDEREFETWLEDHYTQLEIFKMGEKEKKDVDLEWRESCQDYVESCFEDDYQEEEITLRVEEEELNAHKSFRLIGI